MIGRILDGLWRQPARVVALSFVAVAFVGAVALSLPVARAGTERLAPVDALFTATSAVCVTGLIVVDTPSFFSGFGEAVLLLLIQIGGLGIMAFSLSAVFLTRKRLSVGEGELLSFMLNEEDRTNLRGQLLRIIAFTFSIEAVGALLLMTVMESPDHSTIWLAVFHSVSAFCNAGFSLFSDSLSRYITNPVVNATIGGLIVFGGLGFATLSLGFARIHSRLRGVDSPRYSRREASRIAFAGTLILVAVGAVVFYVIESGGVLGGENLATKYVASIFQSITFRTAGFNTIDFTAVHRGTLLAVLPLMFIGAASGGTAGGVKIGTIAVVWADLRRFLFGRTDAVLVFRRVPRRTISQAYVLVVVGFVTAFIASIVLSFVEVAPVETILFEVVSALGTVGLSAGLTPQLSTTGKIVVIVLMFLGRLGPLTLFVAFRPRRSDESVRYPDANVPIG